MKALLFLGCLTGAVSSLGASPQVAPMMSEMAETVSSNLLRGTHERLVFDRDVVRVAVGDPETLTAEVLTGGEVLVLGRELGQTSLLVWFADGTTVSRLFTVKPDLSLLERALRDIHPSIQVETAPDRDAVILRGLVPDVTFRTAAEEAAAAYTDTRNGRNRSLSLIEAPFGSVEGEGTKGGGAAQAVRPGRDTRSGGTVINLIRLESLPPLVDEKLREALAPITGTQVTIRRVQRGDFPDDAADLFVLEGVVPDQVTLARVLFLASRTVLGEGSSTGQDIRVLADEGGALATTNQIFGSSAIGGAAGQTNFSLGGSGGGGGGSAQQSGQLLANRIGANLGRAKVIEAADGKILSLISVEHLPLVRVDVRIYEVNLTRLRNWRNELGVIIGDFDQGDLLPAGEAVALQGGAAASIGQHDIQNVFNFLDGGASNRLQFVTEGFAVDEFFQLLVSEEVARSVSRPSLTVLSGELALFQVGGQVPVSIAQTIGGGTDQVLNSVVFRDFGVQLSVRPLVEEHDSETITLDLTPRISAPDLELTAAIGSATGADVGSTAFETRGARTHTRLRDGDAMLLGGLISQRENRAVGKTPGLGDLPLAGWLFRNEAGNQEEFELVIVVNPVIVRPERPDAHLWAFTSPGEVLASCLREVRSQSTESQSTESQSTESQSTGDDEPEENSIDSGTRSAPPALNP